MQSCIHFDADVERIQRQMHLTANHVREFVGISRTDFQRWLKTLPPYSSQVTQIRKARAFDAHDLVFFATVHFLSTQAGLRLDAIGNFSEPLRNELSKLSDLSHETRWIELNYAVAVGWSIYSDPTQKESEFSVKIDVSSTWFRVHQFLGLTSDWAQSDLPLGLRPVARLTPQQLRI